MNIYEARRLVAEKLDGQVAKVRREDAELPRVAGVDPRSAEGHQSRMRMLPVVARGVSGVIPGTDPLEALLDKYPEEDAA